MSWWDNLTFGGKLAAINNPVAQLLPKKTMARDLADHFGVIGSSKWWEHGGNMLSGEEPANAKTMSNFFQGAGKSSNLGRGIDNFVWDVGAPAVLSAKYGPYAGAAAKGIGHMLATEGEDPKGAAIGAAATFAATKLGQAASAEKAASSADTAWQGQGIGNPENYGGSSAVDTGSRWATWGQNAKNVLGGLKSIMQNGFDKAAAQSPYNNMGLNRFSYLTGIIGDALNPNSSLKGIGPQLAQQNQFNRATQANQAKKSKIKEMMKAILMGEEGMTEKGKPGLTNALITTGKDGKPVFKMEYDLDDLAGIYNPEDNNILSTDQQRQLAQQSDGIDEFEMRLAQAIQAKSRDERDWRWKTDQYADTLRERKADNARQDKYVALAGDKFEYQKTQDTAAQKAAEEKQIRQGKIDARKKIIDELTIEGKRLTNAKAKLEQGIDPETGERLAPEAMQKAISANKREDERNKAHRDAIYMLEGKVPNKSGNGANEVKHPEAVYDLNRRIGEYSPSATNAFLWYKDRPLMVEFMDGRTFGQLYEYATTKRGAKPLNDYINERLMIDIAVGNARLVNPEMLSSGWGDPEDDWNAEINKIRAEIEKRREATNGQ